VLEKKIKKLKTKDNQDKTKDVNQLKPEKKKKRGNLLSDLISKESGYSISESSSSEESID